MNADTHRDQDHPPPPLWRHGLAMLYDTLLIGALILATTLICLLLLHLTIKDHSVPPVLHLMNCSLIALLFFGFFWRRAGQTLGMQAWRIKLVTDSGSPPTWGQVTLRVLGALLSAVSLGAGYWWRFVPPHRRYWHDRLSQTYLVSLPKAH